MANVMQRQLVLSARRGLQCFNHNNHATAFVSKNKILNTTIQSLSSLSLSSSNHHKNVSCSNTRNRNIFSYLTPSVLSMNNNNTSTYRSFSTTSNTSTDEENDNDDNDDYIDESSLDPLTQALLSQPRHLKLRPMAVKRLTDKLKVYEGKEINIRVSPWKLNLVCQFAAGLPMNEALIQLKFCKKGKAPLVGRVIQRTANLADIRDGLLPSQLEVAECFSTHSTPLKRMQFHAKGRTGKKFRRHAHINVKLREINFHLKIAQARTSNQKRKWIMRKAVADAEAEKKREEMDEMADLERRAKEVAERKLKGGK